MYKTALSNNLIVDRVEGMLINKKKFCLLSQTSKSFGNISAVL